MRKVLYSVSLKQADTVKELFDLAQEMSGLILKALKTDKRSLRSNLEKAIFKAKLESYCVFYKTTRDKFLVVQKRDGKNMHCKEPVDFDRLVRDFNWQKTVTYSKPILRNDEDEDYVGSLIGEDDLLIRNEEIMATIFKRTDPDVIESAKTLSEKEFTDLYINTTASAATLKKAYTEIRGVVANEAVGKRVGDEGSSDALGAKQGATGEVLESGYAIGTKVSFTFAGGIVTGKITEELEDNKFIVEELDGTKHTVPVDKFISKTSDKVVKEQKKELEPKTEVEKPKVDKKPTTTKVKSVENNDTLPKFKELEKDKKIEIIQELYKKGFTTTSLVKVELHKSYSIGHYDDVYNMFIKIKK